MSTDNQHPETLYPDMPVEGNLTARFIEANTRNYLHSDKIGFVAEVHGEYALQAKRNAEKLAIGWNEYPTLKAENEQLKNLCNVQKGEIDNAELENERLVGINGELVGAIQGFIDNAIVEKKIAVNQLSYYKGQFAKLIKKSTNQ